jgi:CheY-like chemotaxis protein
MNDELPLQGRAFLVVDDEAFVRGLVVRLLKGLGAWVVEEAADGDAAAAILKGGEYQFDCVLSDFAMRPVNGLRLLADIRTGVGGLKRNTPVLMLTAHSDSALVWAAFHLDTNGFLVKPPRKAELAQRLVRILAAPTSVKSAAAYAEISSTVGRAEAPRPAADAADGPPVNAGIVLGAGGGERPKPAAAPDPAPPQGALAETRVALDKAVEGAVLSRDIFAPGGMLLLRAGTALTDRLMDRLRDLREIDPGFGEVWIRPS